jgi:acetyl-CoA decarbonylase/synthase complex subunit delta
MAVQIIKDRNSGKINTVTIGATAEQGGTRTSTVTVGGHTSLPFASYEGEVPYRPVIAMEVYDVVPEWCDETMNAIGDAIKCPAEWAKKCVEAGADMIYLKLASADPEQGNSSAEKCIETVKSVLGAVGVPLCVVGCGVDEVDNHIIPAVAEACAGENLLIGYAHQSNYNVIAAPCMVYKHTLISSAPLDINICKQTNILISELGMPMERVVLDPSVGGLGYGIEYSYSIQERGRIGALQGDKMLALPVIGNVGFEAWKAKEANASVEDFPGWGDQAERGILWEAVTASTLLEAGIDILVMRHPKAVALTRKHIDDLMVAASL